MKVYVGAKISYCRVCNFPDTCAELLNKFKMNATGKLVTNLKPF